MCHKFPLPHLQKKDLSPTSHNEDMGN